MVTPYAIHQSGAWLDTRRIRPNARFTVGIVRDYDNSAQVTQSPIEGRV